MRVRGRWDFCCVWQLARWVSLRIVLLASAVNAWQFLEEEFGGRTRLTADPTQRYIFCDFQAHDGGLRAAAMFRRAYSSSVVILVSGSLLLHVLRPQILKWVRAGTVGPSNARAC